MANPQRLTAQVSDRILGPLQGQPEPVGDVQQRNGVAVKQRAAAPSRLSTLALAEDGFLFSVEDRTVYYRCKLDGYAFSAYTKPSQIQFGVAGTSGSAAWDCTLRGIFFARAAAVTTRVNGVCWHPFELTLRPDIAANLQSSCVTREGAFRNTQPLPRQTLKRIDDFVHTNIGNVINIHDIAQAACVSPSHLSRLFRRCTGQSLWQYVLDCRVQAAQSLMGHHPHTPLARIAEATGFESYAQFIAAFKKHTGVLPNKYRQLLAG